MSRRSALATIAAGVAAALLTSACPIESTYLDEIEDQIYRDLGPPADPSGLTATALDADRIDLSWSDNADVEQAFEVERKRSAVGEFERIATLSPDSTSYRDTDLDSQTTYFYQVRAVNAGGATVWLSADATTHQ
ncbi:MAG: fibronectin type III domain-containing protein, partial [Spirochaetota bacterium]